jgi:hypothetical protein
MTAGNCPERNLGHGTLAGAPSFAVLDSSVNLFGLRPATSQPRRPANMPQPALDALSSE